MAVATEYATGRRKCAIARAWVTATAGDITVNDKPLEKAFPPLTLRQIIQLPLEMAGVTGKFSIKATPRTLEEGRAPHPGFACERAEKIRPEGRQKAVPVLQALSAGARITKREGSCGLPFFYVYSYNHVLRGHWLFSIRYDKN